jgi:hypothetical protein
MNFPTAPVSPYSAELPRHALKQMIDVARLLHNISENPVYQAFLQNSLPVTALHNPAHAAVMMGYDFHLTPDGVKLIEVNTNAGGLWLSCLAYFPEAVCFPARLGQRLLSSFIDEYKLFCQSSQAYPRLIAILDEQPQQQFLYAEMQMFAKLFQQAGIDSILCDPQELTAKPDGGIYWQNRRVDLIYNRHCDFYLESPAMQNLRQAWLKQQICLTPNPFVYGLLADKRRMIIWSDTQQLQPLKLSDAELNCIVQTVPQTLFLSALTAQQAWQSRKQWVFKPENGYGSRGVYVGDKLTKGKCAEFDVNTTLIQQRIPPSQTVINSELSYKTDFRLFVYRNQVLAVSARLYQGQVTNLRTENGGFAKVRVV